MNVLIADDAGYVRFLISNTLSQAGFNVVGFATTGPEVIEQVSKLKPDVVFLDLVLPHQNGIEVAVEISKQFPAVQIIACSSLDQEWVKQRALDAGCRAYIKKPFSKEDILNSLYGLNQNQEGVQNG